MSELTSIVVIIIISQVTTRTINFFFYFLLEAITFPIISSAIIAELMAASASHVVAAFIFLDPELALSALLCF